MPMSSVVVHYGELALKGRNRPWFINTLVRTIRAALKDLDVGATRKLMGRIEVRLGPDADWDEVRERLAGVPGIRNFSRATHVAADLEVISAGVMAALAGRTADSFRVSARRADKRFPVSSMEMERTLGQTIQAATGWPVNLSRPHLTVHVEVLTSEAFFYFDKHDGAGGLPVGTGGKVLCLLSGGIDSPVAAWRLIRRGCRTDFVHFHSYPILSRTSQDKARTLVGILTRRQLKSRLALVPFGGIQQQVVISVPPPLRVVIYRRLMVRIAERLAQRWHAHALVTGDSLGQVASQTIENLTAVESVATLPVLRPLIGFDKEEIMAEARQLGSYETSIIPDEDCCTLFTPRFPATRASSEVAEAGEADLDVDSLVDKAVADAVVEDSRFPMLKSAVVTRSGDAQ
jgi:thiamine biosynthesis protein ThiI